MERIKKFAVIAFMVVVTGFVFFELIRNRDTGPHDVTVATLAANPKAYNQQTVVVEGRAGKFLEERNVVFFLSGSISPSNKSFYEFSDGGSRIVVEVHSGGYLVPQSVGPAGATDLPSGKLRLKGFWAKDGEYEYVLVVQAADKNGITVLKP
jgi:hypothetical protein